MPSSLSLSLSCLVCALIAYAGTATGTPSSSASVSVSASASASGADELLRIPITRRVLSAPAPTPVKSNLAGTNNAYTTSSSYSFTPGTLRKVVRSNTTIFNDELTSFATSDREGFNNYYTLVYTARIHIGSPPQPFDVVFDTGSADLWVFDGSQISTKQSYIHYFERSASSTLDVTSYHFSITYGKGFAAGYQARDNCTLLGLNTKAWFGLVWSFDEKAFQVPSEPSDGILGFAMKEASTAHHPTLVDELQRAGLIKSRVFSFLLDPTEGGSSSLFILGGADTTFAPAGFAHVTVADFGQRTGMWFIPMQSTSVGGAMPFSCSSATPCVALVDTGTSILVVPPPMLSSLWSQISSARSDCILKGYDKITGDWSEAEIWCKDFTYDHMPLITFRLGGSSFVVYPSDYVIVNGGLLMIGIQALNLGDIGCGVSCYQFILGDVFLKMHYSVFDMDQKVISIAKDYDRPRPSAPTRPGNTQTISPRFWYYLLAIGGGLVLLFVIFLLCRRCHMRRLEVSMHSQGIYHGRERLLQHQHQQQTVLPLSQRAGGYRLGGPSASASASASVPSSSSVSQYRPSPYAYAPGAQAGPSAPVAPTSGSGSGSGSSWWSRSQPAANPTQSEGQY